MGEEIEVFICYAHEDELLCQGLEKQLSGLQRQGLITVWYDRNISPGADWKQEIDTHLNKARIILLLVSPDFMASDYCYSIEMERAMQRHEQGLAKILPVILRPVYWQEAPFGKLQALPTNATPVTSWSDRDEAFLDITRSIIRPTSEISDGDNTDREATSSQPATELPKDFSITMSRDEQTFSTHEIKGTYSSKGLGQVWVILEDKWHYYLQNPPVEFLDNGEWIAKNICPGKGIKRVHVVHVDPEGDHIFQQKVDNNEFDGFNDLPSGSTILWHGPIVERQVTRPKKHFPTQLTSDFSVTTLKDGQAISNKDVPLTIKGMCTLKDIGQVWVVLRDTYKYFHLQNPPVEFLDNGEWIAENIRPLRGITAVVFVRVSREGNRVFQRKVDNNEWGHSMIFLRAARFCV